MVRFRRCIAAGVAVLAIAAVTVAAEDGTGSAPLAADRRLSQPVTVEVGRVYLGELLGKLSQETHVPLSVENTKGPLDGVELSVRLRNQPLREVMAAVAEVLTHRYHRCEWRETGTGSGYLLRHYPSLEAASAVAQAAIRSKWSADVRAYYEIARLPSPERGQRAAARPDLFPGGIENHPEFRLMGQLEPGQLGAALNGLETRLKLDQLPADSRPALSFGQSVQPGSPSTSGLGKPAPAGFYATWERANVSPILWVRNADGVATNLVGGTGWDHNWLATTGEGWRDSGDQEVQRFLIQLTLGKSAPGQPLKARTLPEWLRALHDAQRTDFILDPVAPLAGSRTGAARLGASSEESLYYLMVANSLTAKQYGKIQLLRHQTACVSPRRHLVTWAQVQRLRDGAERGRGHIGMRELVELSGLSDAQLEALTDEFPVANSGEIGVWRPLLRFSENLAERDVRTLGQPEGILLADCGLGARNILIPPGEATLSATPGAPITPARAALAHVREVLSQDPAHARISLRREWLPGRKPDVPRLICEAWLPGKARQRMEYPLPPPIPPDPD